MLIKGKGVTKEFWVKKKNISYTKYDIILINVNFHIERQFS